MEVLSVGSQSAVAAQGMVRAQPLVPLSLSGHFDAPQMGHIQGKRGLDVSWPGPV